MGTTEAAHGRAMTNTVRGGWLGFAGSGINAVFGFLLVAVVTHAIGARGAGAVFTGVALFTILSNAFKLGADTGLVRFVARDLATTGGAGIPALLRTALLPGLAASTVGAVILWCSPGVAFAVFPDLPRDDAVTMMRLFAVFLPLTTGSLTALGATRGYGGVLPFVGAEQIGKPVLRVLLALPLGLLAPGVLALSAAWLLPSVAGAVIAWLALRRSRRLNPPPTTSSSAGPAAYRGPGRDRIRAGRSDDDAGPNARSSGAPAQGSGAARKTPGPAGGSSGAAAVRQAPQVSPGREFWSFAGPRAISSIFDIAAVWVGVIVLSLLATAEAAGIYTAVGRIITAGTLLQLAVRLAVAPQISRLLAGGERDRGEAHQLHRLSTRWIVLFSLPVFGLLAVFPRTVLAVFGTRFAPGAAALVVLCVASAVNVCVGNAQTVILMAGRSSWNLAVSGVAFAVQVGLGLALVPKHGVLGAALAWGVALVVDNVASAALVRYRLGFRTVDRGYVAAVVLGLLAVSTAAVPVRLAAGDCVGGALSGTLLSIVLFTTGLWRYRERLGVRDFFGALRQRRMQAALGSHGFGGERQ